jgi:hypothetical protein
MSSVPGKRSGFLAMNGYIVYLWVESQWNSFKLFFAANKNGCSLEGKQPFENTRAARPVLII